MKIIGISSEHVETLWPVLVPLIAPALEHDHNDLSLDAILADIKAGKYCCLAVMDNDEIIAVQTAQIFTEDNGNRIFNLVTTAGTRLDEWQDLLSGALDKLAKEFNCQYIHTRGRLGWLRALKRNGYQPLYFIAEKKVA